jgi:ribonuclease D
MEQPPRQISHEELMQLPIVRYHGPIHLVRTEADLRAARQAIRHEHVVGFDTETRPTFHKGQSHPPALVQIAGGKGVYLFPLARVHGSEIIAEMLGNPHLVKTGIALDRDLVELSSLFPIEPRNVVDLGVIAKRAGFTQTGVRNLAGLFLQVRIAKGVRTSNWARANLTASQLTYAATDAWICRELYFAFEKRGLTLTPMDWTNRLPGRKGSAILPPPVAPRRGG